MSETAMDMQTKVAIGSALVHADELLTSWNDEDDAAMAFDFAALRTCLHSQQVLAWLEQFEPGLLPVKRSR